MQFPWILFLTLFPVVLPNPTGCTYDAATVLYTCNARSWVLPLAFASFTVQPQRILLKDVAGELPSAAPNGPTFSGFSAMNTASFDSRFSPSFHIMCYANSYLLIFKDTFTDFGWVEEIIIQDCDILSLPTQVFSNFGDVNSFIIQGGSLTNMVPDSFSGLNVKRITTAKSPRGEFIIRNSQIVSGELSFGALYTLTNAAVIVLDSCHLTSLRMDTFHINAKLTNLSLSYNDITSLSELMLSKSYALSHLTIRGFPWTCTCTDLWIVPFVANNNITLNGDLVCSTPTSQKDKRITTFYQSNCVSYDPCNGLIGIIIGTTCHTIMDITGYIFFVLMTVVTCVSFGLVMNLYFHLKEIKDRRKGFMLRRNFFGGNGEKVSKTEAFETRIGRPIKPRDPSFD